jgi:hypothetical protein
MNVCDSLLIAGASDPALQRFNNSTLLNFPRNRQPDCAQYTNERPDFTSQDENPKKAKTTTKEN